jgi:hypothetical protein
MEKLFNEVDGGKGDAMNKIIWFYKQGMKNTRLCRDR